MRHYAVLAFAFVKMNNLVKAIPNMVRAIWSSPVDCIDLIVKFIKK